MELKEVTTKEEWEGFLQTCSEKTFLQSWNWGEFSAKGGKIWRLGAYAGERIMGVALVIKVAAKRGIFLYIPHGPVVSENATIKDAKEVLELILIHLSDIAKQENASFIRVAPIYQRKPENEQIFSDLGFRPAPMHASAYEATWKLDLQAPQDQLLANMRKTTRYLVKKAGENPDIAIEMTNLPSGIADYQKLNKEVAKRQKFTPFSDEFIKKEIEIFSQDNQALLFFGKYRGQIAAGAVVIFWQGIAFYHQAASLGKFAKHSIPYLLQWQAICEAKRRGCLVYDFWGFTDPEKFPKHPWAGPTLFKMGFGGYKKKYIPTQDFVISQKYWINYIIEKIRKFRRGL